jgi:hypothetical protein
VIYLAKSTPKSINIYIKYSKEYKNKMFCIRMSVFLLFVVKSAIWIKRYFVFKIFSIIINIYLFFNIQNNLIKGTSVGGLYR